MGLCAEYLLYAINIIVFEMFLCYFNGITFGIKLYAVLRIINGNKIFREGGETVKKNR